MSTRRFHGLRGVVFLTLGVSLAVIAAGCSSSGGSGSSSSLTTVRVANDPSVGSLPFEVAVREGYFKANGLNVQVTNGSNLPTFIAGLGSQFDMSIATPVLVFQAIAKGKTLSGISNLNSSSQANPNDVLVMKSKPASYADLDGKKIAAPNLTGMLVTAMNYLVKKAGGDPSTITYVALDFPTMNAQLAAGNVAGILTTAPYYYSLRSTDWVSSDFYVQALSDVTDGASQNAVEGLYASTASYAKSHATVIAAWRKSLSEADSYIANHPTQARSMMQAWLDMTASSAKSVVFPNFSVSLTDMDLSAPLKLLQSMGIVPSSVTASEAMYTP